MYTKGNLIEDYFAEATVFSREILDPSGDVICYVIENGGEDEGFTAADVLLSHLNR